MDSAYSIHGLVCSTLAEAAKRDVRDLTDRTSLADLAIDSLSLTTLIAQLEATFSIQLSADEKMAIYDADDLGTIVAVAQGAARGGGAAAVG